MNSQLPPSPHSLVSAADMWPSKVTYVTESSLSLQPVKRSWFTKFGDSHRILAESTIRLISVEFGQRDQEIGSKLDLVVAHIFSSVKFVSPENTKYEQALSN
jgi:hypothetical protein